MAWIYLTVEDAARRVTGPELEACRETALAKDQQDPVPEIITAVINQVRGKAGVKNKLGPAGTIPHQLESAALDLICAQILSRIPVESLFTEARKLAQKYALDLLEDLARGTFVIEESEAPGPEIISSPTPLISEPCLDRTSQHSNGL